MPPIIRRRNAITGCSNYRSSPPSESNRRPIRAMSYPQLGAMIFFGARVAMAIGHTFAITFLRSVAWFVSLAGLIMILTQIL